VVQGQGDAKRRKAEFAIGCSGVFFTTQQSRGAVNAHRDLIRLLEDEAPARGSDLSLDAEVAQMKETGFSICNHEIAKGTGFITFSGSVKDCVPSELVLRALEKQKAAFCGSRIGLCSRQLCRVLPIDHTCKPHIDSFKKLALEVLPTVIGSTAEPTVWALEFRTRNTTTLKKDAVLEVIDSIVDKSRHKVSLNDPEKCILVEANPIFCGLSVVRKWSELKKYNVHAITSPQVSKGTQAVTAPSGSGVSLTATVTGSVAGSVPAEAPPACEPAPSPAAVIPTAVSIETAPTPTAPAPELAPSLTPDAPAPELAPSAGSDGSTTELPR